MTPEQHESLAFEMIQKAWEKLEQDLMMIEFRIQLDYPGGNAKSVKEDGLAVQKVIKDGWEMFHEIWSESI